jgi:hypothetical protein
MEAQEEERENEIHLELAKMKPKKHIASIRQTE